MAVPCVTQVCWEWMFTHIPLWVHPNVLTVCGLMANFIAALFVIYYDPNILGKVNIQTGVVLGSFIGFQNQSAFLN